MSNPTKAMLGWGWVGVVTIIYGNWVKISTKIKGVETEKVSLELICHTMKPKYSVLKTYPFKEI